MAESIYALCAATSALCAFLLMRAHRRSGSALLLWSFVGFAGLFAANALLFVDKVIAPGIDLTILRSAVSLTALLALLGGLIWESRS